MKKSTIFTIVFLVGAYVVCQAIADVGATKMIQLFNTTLPAGSLVFALTFTLRDLLHKRLGKEWARAAIIIAGLFNIFQAFYLWAMSLLPTPAFFTLGDAWKTIFAIVPAITIGSIIAELISELVDTEVYHLWMTKIPKSPQWARVLISNAVSLPLDSFIFGTLAFVVLPPLFGAQVTPFSAAMGIVGGQIIWKAIITVVSMPLIYLVKDNKKLLPSTP